MEMAKITPSNNKNIPALPATRPAMANPEPDELFFLVLDKPAILSPRPTGTKISPSTGRIKKLTSPATDVIKPQSANLSTFSFLSSFTFLVFFDSLLFVFGASIYEIFDAETVLLLGLVVRWVEIAACTLHTRKKARNNARLNLFFMLG